MKYLLIPVLALAAFPAFATTDIKCDGNAISFTFQSAQSLALVRAPVQIEAHGMMDNTYSALVESVEEATPGGQLTVNLVTLDEKGQPGPVSIRGRLELPLAADGETVGEKGRLVITSGARPGIPRIQPKYELAGCKGHI